VNQTAERILFSPDPEGGTQMHVQIQYQGPPDEFSWLLPVPAGTTFGVSRPALFAQLDQRYQPTFRLNRITPEYCSPRPDQRSVVALDNAAGDTQAEEATVQVTSQSQVGPYEQVTLRADNVEVLTTWLDENGYQVPPDAEESLSPYIGEYEFLAIKLASGRESGDIQPVSLLLPTDTPTIPLRPTAVAAQPDMGVIVHLLGDARGVPTNYQLVELNYAALNWFSPGQHYAQLVSHAVDQAEEGRAFVTDFAGAHDFDIDMVAPLVAPNLVLSMEEVRNGDTLYSVLTRLLTDLPQSDLNDVLIGALPLEREQSIELIGLATLSAPEDNVRVTALLTDEEGAWITIDGAAIAADLKAYNDGGQALIRAFTSSSYLTRLYTTLNASEMSVDPSFSFNADLEDVASAHQADLYLDCDGIASHIITADGLEVDLDGENIQPFVSRQDGVTVRAEDTIGAAVIYRPMSAGQPEVVTDRRVELSELYRRATPDESHGCQQGRQRSRWPLGFMMLLTLTLITRARRIA
jgi:hypothetical protein